MTIFLILASFTLIMVILMKLSISSQDYQAKAINDSLIPYLEQNLSNYLKKYCSVQKLDILVFTNQLFNEFKLDVIHNSNIVSADRIYDYETENRWLINILEQITKKEILIQ